MTSTRESRRTQSVTPRRAAPLRAKTAPWLGDAYSELGIDVEESWMSC